MLALEPVITARLAAALPAGWTCMGVSATPGQRDDYPLASVSLTAARAADSKMAAANLQPAWAVAFIARRTAGTSALIDAAVSAAIEALHNWAPGVVGGRPWTHLRLEQAAPYPAVDAGLIGVELIFTTTARYDGQA